jgi:hypothetical protein
MGMGYGAWGIGFYRSLTIKLSPIERIIISLLESQPSIINFEMPIANK